MIILNKNQTEIEVKMYKADDKIKIMFPDENWIKYHFSKADHFLIRELSKRNINTF